MLEFFNTHELTIGIWLVAFIGFASIVAGRALLGVLALLWQIFCDAFVGGFFTVWTAPGWWAREEIEDGLPDGGHAWLWRWPYASLFPSRCFKAGGLQESEGDHRHQAMSV